MDELLEEECVRTRNYMFIKVCVESLYLRQRTDEDTLTAVPRLTEMCTLCE